MGEFITRKHILVIDEDEAWLAFVAETLANDKYSVETVNDISDGLVAARERQYDLILIDDSAFSEQHFESFRHLVILCEKRRIVVVFSSSPDWQVMRKAYALGVTNHFVKTSAERALLMFVEQILTR